MDPKFTQLNILEFSRTYSQKSLNLTFDLLAIFDCFKQSPTPIYIPALLALSLQFTPIR